MPSQVNPVCFKFCYFTYFFVVKIMAFQAQSYTWEVRIDGIPVLFTLVLAEEGF